MRRTAIRYSSIVTKNGAMRCVRRSGITLPRNVTKKGALRCVRRIAVVYSIATKNSAKRCVRRNATMFPSIVAKSGAMRCVRRTITYPSIAAKDGAKRCVRLAAIMFPSIVAKKGAMRCKRRTAIKRSADDGREAVQPRLDAADHLGCGPGVAQESPGAVQGAGVPPQIARDAVPLAADASSRLGDRGLPKDVDQLEGKQGHLFSRRCKPRRECGRRGRATTPLQLVHESCRFGRTRGVGNGRAVPNRHGRIASMTSRHGCCLAREAPGSAPATEQRTRAAP